MRIRNLLAAAGIALGSLLVVAHPAMAEDSAGTHVSGNIKDSDGLRCFNDHLSQGGTVDDCKASPNPLLPDSNELLYGGSAFLIILIVLSKLGYPAIKKAMNDRTERIRGEIDEADKLKAEAAATLAQYQASVADSKTEAARIVDEARTAAEAVRADIIARAEAEANEIKTKAREDVEAGKARAITELQTQVGDLTIALAEKVVERSLDDATNRQLIDNYINNLGNN